MQTKLIFSREDSPANLIQVPESDLGRTMLDTSGRRCLERLERSGRAGSLAKMLLGSLVGMAGWSLKRSALTWKMKGTKYSRLYFQLYPLAHHTDEIESGLSPAESNKALWLTPTSVQRDHPERVTELIKTGAETIYSRNNGEKRPNSILDMAMFTGLLPTPVAMDQKNGHRTVSRRINRKVKQGRTVQLNDMATLGMLPTPNASDNRDRGGPKDAAVQKRVLNGKQVGLTMLVNGQLNPRFVAEMMGFPPSWLELPFQDGKTAEL